MTSWHEEHLTTEQAAERLGVSKIAIDAIRGHMPPDLFEISGAVTLVTTQGMAVLGQLFGPLVCGCSRALVADTGRHARGCVLRDVVTCVNCKQQVVRTEGGTLVVADALGDSRCPANLSDGPFPGPHVAEEGRTP